MSLKTISKPLPLVVLVSSEYQSEIPDGTVTQDSNGGLQEPPLAGAGEVNPGVPKPPPPLN
jgi:hypothetical protein